VTRLLRPRSVTSQAEHLRVLGSCDRLDDADVEITITYTEHMRCKTAFRPRTPQTRTTGWACSCRFGKKRLTAREVRAR